MSVGNIIQTVSVRPYVDHDAGRWNEYVSEHPEGTFFHLSEWKRVLERALGHRAHYLVAEADGKLAGVLPLGQIRSRFFGNSLISTPFCVYGGVLADSDDVRRALTDEACRLAERLEVDYLELRNQRPANPDWPSKDLYVTFRKQIDPDPEVNLKAIPRRQRAMIRKGGKQGLISEIDDSIDRFVPIYAESVRNLGTPVFPRRLFEELSEAFAERCEVLTVLRDGVPVSSVLSFYFRDEVLPYYGGGTGAARGLAANDFMYWELMRRSADRGIRWFDYGRSKRDVGSYRFKKHWGFEPQQLHYEYYLVRASAVPDVNPLNPKYQRFVKMWQRLPLPVSRFLGPFISRNLG